MRKSHWLLYSTIFAICCAHSVNAEEIKIAKEMNTKLNLSIYNNNLGFIKDTRKVNLDAGKSTIAFEGVSEKIRAETAMLNGAGVKVLEQNYDYAILTPANILEASIGEKVRVATTNPQTGAEILTPAEIVTSNYGTPVLKFDYGYEPNPQGRIIYNKLPENLRTQPTLVISLENATNGEKELELAYLTQGLSWTANYIAELTSDSELNLNGLVTLKNESGTDYANAQIQLVAGEVNHQEPRAMMMHSYENMADNLVFGASADSMPAREKVSDYHIYTLPNPTTIVNKQVKQVSLMNKQKVAFEKKYEFISPFYLSSRNGSNSFFEEKNPQIIFSLVNTQASGLGEPIPAGTVRLYKNDTQGNLQYIGEDSINHTPVDGKIELETGKAFDIIISGKITETLALSKDLYQKSIEITFKNSSDKIANVDFVQDFREEHSLLEESQKSELENPNRRVWKISIEPNSQNTLTFKVRLNK